MPAKSTTERLKDVFGEVPPFGEMAKMTKAEEKKVKALNKKYKCEDGVVVEKVKKSKTPSSKPSPWIAHLKAYYEKAKAKNPKYSYKQAMKDAKASYTPVEKVSKKTKK